MAKKCNNTYFVAGEEVSYEPDNEVYTGRSLENAKKAVQVMYDEHKQLYGWEPAEVTFHPWTYEGREYPSLLVCDQNPRYFIRTEELED